MRIPLFISIMAIACESRAPIKLLSVSDSGSKFRSLSDVSGNGTVNGVHKNYIVVFKKENSKDKFRSLSNGNQEPSARVLHIDWLRSLIGTDSNNKTAAGMQRSGSLGSMEPSGKNNASKEKIYGQVGLGDQFSGYIGKFSNETINTIADKDEIDYIEEELQLSLHSQFNVPSYGLQKISSINGKYYSSSCNQNVALSGLSGSGNNSVSSGQSGNTTNSASSSKTNSQTKNSSSGSQNITTNGQASLNGVSDSGSCLPLDQNSSSAEKKAYFYNEPNGKNVTIYVIDSGINIIHTDFTGRLRAGLNIVESEENTDLFHHGTHVAGIISGTSFGVSKSANLVSVKIFNKQGAPLPGSFLQSLDWIAKDYTQLVQSGGPKQAVVNLSLGSKGQSSAYDSAINALVDMGMIVVVSAGNDAADACQFTPASNKNVITVGATDADDKIAYFSNYGKCIDIFAPGVDIVSADYASEDGSRVLSGTSMAAPHITGLVAYFVSEFPNLTPAQTKTIIKSLSRKNQIKGDLKESPNEIAYNGANVFAT
ncbi:Alkaline protease 2 [Smittium mucronatum]|uniref:Alkaline protease 2 n=1 Tax=Smittium mucronatum TaxID=133383 RepID=A0A1R0GYA2_9FUNG|nr:Alkaline protease 2 [Smittium mucronatum]